MDAFGAADKLRAQAVIALRNEENLSLAQLGECLAYPKARAADIVNEMSGKSAAE